MNDYENKCYVFVEKLAVELAQCYYSQYQHMEEFARWNLPEEIALEWIDAAAMVDVLEQRKCISAEKVQLLREIISAFVFEFENSNNSIWTHKAMEKDDFWNMQRLRARKFLDDNELTKR